MSSLVFFEEMTNRTAPIAQGVASNCFKIAAALTLSLLNPTVAIVKPSIDKSNLSSSDFIATGVSTNEFFRHHHSLQIGSAFEVGAELPPFALEWIDAEIDAFMTSVSNGEERVYSDELLAMAEKLIEDNPQAFKNFL